MKKLFIVFALAVIFSASLNAQDFSGKSHNVSWMPANVMTDALMHSFNVLDYKLNIDIYNSFSSPYPKSYRADVIIRFRADSVLNNINLNAVYASLVVDSVRLYPSNTVLNFNHSSSSDMLNITLDRQYNVGEIVQARIYFRHNNVSDNAFYASSGYVFTDFPPQGCRKFMPCWDEPYDKATFEVRAKVPLNVRLGSNGRLNDSTVTGDTIYYHWISRDPVATYLIVLTGRAGYAIDIVHWHPPSNPNDSIPIRFYHTTGQNLGPVKNVILDMTSFYSDLFGVYPFEKGGFAYVPGSAGFPWAGMENQTLITMYAWQEALGSHEYAHMWFGDLITCGTWPDVWLNEGFATYCEALWIEHKSGYSAYKSRCNQFGNAYLSGNPGWALNNPPMNDLYNYAMVYCKGACVLHMLRYVVGDTVFFNCMNSYATDTMFMYKHAVTDDLIAKVNSVAGQDLYWFFNQWVKQPNHPVYQNTYSFTEISPSSYRVKFTAKQTQSNPPFFKMPLELKISFTSGPDTMVTVMNDANNQEFNFYFDRQPSALSFDPDRDILIKAGTTAIGIAPISGIVPDRYELYQNFPNPFNPVTSINFDIPENSFVRLVVYDITGREISVLVNENLKAGSYKTSFIAENLPSGIYFCRFDANSFSAIKKMVSIK